MNVGSSRALSWAALVLAAGSACSSSPASPVECRCPNHAREHIVLLQSEKDANGKRRAAAHPDFITVRGYNPKAPDSVVLWVYHHKSTRIVFDRKARIPDPVCNDEKKVCELKLPAGLAFGTKYKYTVTGQDADGADFEPNDPFIEVDR